MSSDTEYMIETIKNQLTGTQIRNAIMDSTGEFFGFQVVKKAEGRGNYDVLTVWVNCDAEGNGPGWLDIEEAVI